MKRVFSTVCVILVAAAVIFGGRWYIYITTARTPYDEVGIALNGRMPAPLRAWGCGRLHERFPGQLPPYGCAAPDGHGWS